jgi:hypothetical protein
MKLYPLFENIKSADFEPVDFLKLEKHIRKLLVGKQFRGSIYFGNHKTLGHVAYEAIIVDVDFTTDKMKVNVNISGYSESKKKSIKDSPNDYIYFNRNADYDIKEEIRDILYDYFGLGKKKYGLIINLNII